MAEAQIMPNEITVKKHSIFPVVPAQSWVALLMLWLVFMVNGNLREIMNRIIPSIQGTYNIQADSLGLIIGVIMIGQAVLAMPGGRWADAGGQGWGRKYRNLIIAFGYCICSVLTGVPALTVGVGGFLIFQFAKSMFSGIGEAIEVGTVAEWWPNEYRGFALGLHHTAYPWGSFIGGWLIAAILAGFGDENWRMCFLLIPLMMVPIFIAYWIFANKKQYNQFENKTRAMGLTCPLETEGEAHELKAAPGVVGRSLRNPNIFFTTVTAGCCLLGYVGIGFWLSPYLAFVAKYSYAAAAGLSVIFTITGGLGQIFWGWLSDIIGRKLTLFICCIWIGIAFLLFQYVSVSLAALIIIQLVAGVCTNAVYPVMYSICCDSAEKGGIGTALGINLVGLYIGGGLAPMILGVLINVGGGWNSASGYITGMYFMAGVMFLGALVTLLFTRETNGPWFKRDFSLVSLKSCNLE